MKWTFLVLAPMLAGLTLMAGHAQAHGTRMQPSTAASAMSAGPPDAGTGYSQGINSPRQSPEKNRHKGAVATTGNNRTHAVSMKVELARLAAKIRSEKAKLSKFPKIKFINSTTREEPYLSYMQAWAKRVEQVGTANFPAAARTGKSDNDVILSVALNRDGSILRITIVKSSGSHALDQAADRIVRMAGPFPPIPQPGQHYDELIITRVFQFLQKGERIVR